MKKVSFLCMIAAIVVSCAKEPGTNNDPVKVTFNVAGLDVTTENMTKAGETPKAATDGLTKIQYAVGGKTGTQVNTDTGFGTIELWLTPGTYTAYFAATTDPNKGIVLDKTSGSSPYYYINENNADVFYIKKTLTIVAGTNNYTIELPRLTGQLVIDLTDTDVPADISKATAEFRNLGQYNTSTATASASAYKTTDITITNGAFDDMGYYLFPVTNESVTISLLDANGGVLGTTSVNFDIIANKRTIIRGNILDIITQKALSITYADTWDDDNVVNLQ